MAASPPNIVYLHSHDTGRYTQPYGYPVATPHLQRLAEDGITFRQAFCAAPTCSPSRAALLTGQCAHSSGMLGLAHRGFRLNDYRQHLVHTLRAAGYFTVLCGVQHVARNAEEIGYDAILGKAANAESVAAAFVDHVEADDKPFFLDVGFAETHRAGGVHFHEAGPEGGAEAPFTRPPAPLPDTPATRADMADFCASARTLDEKMGAVLDALQRNGLADRTLVICTTDHGIAFPRMKCHLTDYGIGVMLLLRGPSLPQGTVSDALVSHIDLFPTICEMVGIERPAWLQGVSLVPLLNGTAAATGVNEAIFAEVTFHAAYEPQRAVRTARYKYIRRFDPRPGPVLPNVDDSPSKDVLLAAGWRDHAPRTEQLYDLVFDPNEADNRAGDPALASVLSDMRARLDDWMRRTGDPLLAGNGTVTPLPGTILNDPDGLSPREPTFTA